MGVEIDDAEYTAADYEEFLRRVREQVSLLGEMMSSQTMFDTAHPRAGLEVEVNLVDAAGNPAMRNAEVLQVVNDPHFVTELGRFNVEINLSPRQLGPRGLAAFEATLTSDLDDARTRIEPLGLDLCPVGILPTLDPTALTIAQVTDSPRYRALDRRIVQRRGAAREIALAGREPLRFETDTIAAEAACTSMQIHLQVAPADLAPYWNASQAIAGVQLALGANSPFVGGRHLVAESRLPLFTAAADDRDLAARAANVSPRVLFGFDWARTGLDLFERNLHVAPLVAEWGEEDAAAVLAAGSTPALSELCLHNGTVYRWNRPVYDTTEAGPHLRVENRVLPAGPTVRDMIANMAFYAGLTRALAEQEHPVWAETPFEVARANLDAGVAHGIDAEIRWPGRGSVSAPDLVLDTLLPLAAAGLEAYGVRAEDVGTWLGIIEGRCTTRTNGASWQVATVAAHEARGSDRPTAIRAMVEEYVRRAHENEPVHTWAGRDGDSR